MAYSTRISVLREAGLWHRELDETPTGATNGSNVYFYVQHKPLADNDGDDTLEVTDVTLYVDGTAVTVSAVDATTGKITAAVAPASNTEVTVDYSWQNVTDDDVDDVIEEADAAIDDALSSIGVSYSTSATVRKISRTYAAGLLMAREYGLQQIDESVKEGERKIKQAEKWLEQYAAVLLKNADDSSTSVRANDDVRLFQTYDTTEGTWGPRSDEQFSLERPE